MKKRVHTRTAFLACSLLLIGLVLPCVLWVQKEQRQYALNRQLIQALKKSDIRQAIVVVEVGADPNTRYDPTPAPSLPELVNQLLHHSSPPVNESPTALMIACGTGWGRERTYNTAVFEGMPGPYWRYQTIKFVDPQLTKAMLLHDGDINARGIFGWTALHWAVSQKNIKVVKHLMRYGADPNLIANGYGTPISFAENENRPDIVALLRREGIKK